MTSAPTDAASPPPQQPADAERQPAPGRGGDPARVEPRGVEDPVELGVGVVGVQPAVHDAPDELLGGGQPPVVQAAVAHHAHRGDRRVLAAAQAGRHERGVDDVDLATGQSQRVGHTEDGGRHIGTARPVGELDLPDAQRQIEHRVHGLGIRRRRTHRGLVRHRLLPGPAVVGLVMTAPGEPHGPADPAVVEHPALARPLRAGLVAELVELISHPSPASRPATHRAPGAVDRPRGNDHASGRVPSA